MAGKDETAHKPKPSQQQHKYVYGYALAPPDIIEQLSYSSTVSPDDPFGGGGQSAPVQSLYQLCPMVPTNQVPQCLPKGPTYQNLKSIYLESGVNIKTPEWIILSHDLDGRSMIHFCTTPSNADIIASISCALHCRMGPRTCVSRADLVSIPTSDFPSTQLPNQAMSFHELAKLDLEAHARIGLHMRSGEKSTTSISNHLTHAEITFETTIGEANTYYDSQLEFKCQLSKQINIYQKVTFTGLFDAPFALDCGTHGAPARRFFLIIRKTIASPGKPIQEKAHDYRSYKILKQLNTIEGQYAFNQTTPKDNTTITNQSSFTTRFYKTSPHFLLKLRYHAESSTDDPFEEADEAFYQATPERVAELPPSIASFTKDQIYDISPRFKELGIVLQEGEWVYFNQTQNRLISHGSIQLPYQVCELARQISQSPRQVKVRASIISVNQTLHTSPEWSSATIQKANPNAIVSYATVARSGECAKTGKQPTNTSQSPKETEESSELYEFEFEPTIAEDNQTVDCRIHLQSQELTPGKLTITLNTAITAKDGEPTIIELGHPSSDTRTILLVLHTDIITPDGSYYRDRFKPITP